MNGYIRILLEDGLLVENGMHNHGAPIGRVDDLDFAVAGLNRIRIGEVLGTGSDIAAFDQTATFTAFRLPDGQPLVLCRGCELEEFLVPAGWGNQLAPGEKLPVNALRRVRGVEGARLRRAKFCPACNLRLAFLAVIADNRRQTEQDAPADRPPD